MMKIFPTQSLQLVFHRGAKAKPQLHECLINDASGMFKWITNDRALAKLIKAKENLYNEANLEDIVNRYVGAIEISNPSRTTDL
ncbi:MAG: hypothetical protein M3512_01155 [Bacteroidota bacterium]|nr:hypothetical protein [Bacteroidota bacterium]